MVRFEFSLCSRCDMIDSLTLAGVCHTCSMRPAITKLHKHIVYTSTPAHTWAG